MKKKRIFKYGTGAVIPEGAIYLSTVRQTKIKDPVSLKWHLCWFVWHYFWFAWDFFFMWYDLRSFNRIINRIYGPVHPL